MYYLVGHDVSFRYIGILVFPLNRFPMLSILIQDGVPGTSFQIASVLSQHRTSKHLQV